MELLLILFILFLGGARLAQLRKEDLPRTSEGTAPDAEGAESGAGADLSFNPATGLPMWDDEPDSLDLEGNMWGFDDETLPMHRHPADQRLFHRLDESFGTELDHSMINPATGLPMMGSVDVAGNLYGSSLGGTSSGGAFDSDWGPGSNGMGDFHDSFGSGVGSLSSFDSGSGSSGTGFDSDW